VRQLAAKLAHRVPRIVRYLMRGLGSDASINELTSYLLVDPELYCRLIDLGERDVAAERGRIEQFFTRRSPGRG
jgi:NTE family protein